jgi:cytochrome b
MKTPILVWDLPTRLFHWMLVASFAGAWLTADSERYRDLHVMLGYTLAGLIGFRLVWGLVGSRYARFSEFVRGPAAVRDYLGSLLAGRPQAQVGHNPAGGVAILLLLALGVVASVTGWAVYEDVGGEWLEEAHELASNAMLALVGVHIVAVLVSSRLHGENLVRSMLTGYKLGEPDAGIRRARPLLALALLAAVVGYWGSTVTDTPPWGSAQPAAVGMHADPRPGRSGRGREDD